MDEIIEIIESANLEHKYAAKEKVDNASLEAQKGLEMRRMSVESMRESTKRKNSDGGKEKRTRRTRG